MGEILQATMDWRQGRLSVYPAHRKSASAGDAQAERPAYNFRHELNGQDAPKLFMAMLPPVVPCSNEHASREILPAALAVQRQHLYANEGVARFLVVDVDEMWSGAAWIDAGLPPPLCVVERQASGHCHMIWALAAPVRRDSPKPARFWRDLGAKFAARLPGGDRGYVGNGFRSPFSAGHRTMWCVARRWTLGDLAASVEGDRPSVPVRQASDSACPLKGRNTWMFDGLRTHALGIRRSGRPFRVDQLMIEGERLNGKLPNPLPAGEVRSVALSVARYDGRGTLFGVSKLGRGRDGHHGGGRQYARDPETGRWVGSGEHLAEDEVKRRQALAGRATSAARGQAARAKVFKALVQLRYFATNAQVAEAAGVSLTTVKRYRDELHAEVQAFKATAQGTLAKDPPLGGAQSSSSPVHQAQAVHAFESPDRPWACDEATARLRHESARIERDREELAKVEAHMTKHPADKAEAVGLALDLERRRVDKLLVARTLHSDPPASAEVLAVEIGRSVEVVREAMGRLSAVPIPAPPRTAEVAAEVRRGAVQGTQVRPLAPRPGPAFVRGCRSPLTSISASRDWRLAGRNLVWRRPPGTGPPARCRAEGCVVPLGRPQPSRWSLTQELRLCEATEPNTRNAAPLSAHVRRRHGGD